jgi:acyl dehydratase
VEDPPSPGPLPPQVNRTFKAPVRPGDTINGEVKAAKVCEDEQITDYIAF